MVWAGFYWAQAGLIMFSWVLLGSPWFHRSLLEFFVNRLNKVEHWTWSRYNWTAKGWSGRILPLRLRGVPTRIRRLVVYQGRSAHVHEIRPPLRRGTAAEVGRHPGEEMVQQVRGPADARDHPARLQPQVLLPPWPVALPQQPRQYRPLKARDPAPLSVHFLFFAELCSGLG